jgi:hypothetical protein
MSGYYSPQYSDGNDLVDDNEPTPEQLRTFINNEINTANNVAAIDKAASDFVALYKPRGYKDTTANAKQVNNALSLLGKTQPTIADFEDIYARLVANNMLDLDKSKLSALEKQEEEIRIAQYLDNQFDEATAYTLPLDELRRRAGGSVGGW